MQLLIIVAAFVGVAALVGAIALMFRGNSGSAIEDRLDVLAGGKTVGASTANEPKLLASPLDETRGIAEAMFSRIGNVRNLLDQADISISPGKFFLLTLILAGVGALVALHPAIPLATAPLLAAAGALLPIFCVWYKRKRRMAAFAKQLPEALELISRALRAGHSLAAGCGLVGEEMSEPIEKEFLRCFEEQNLGIPLDEALEGMTERVPNLDLRFFATAVILQRTTGGDLAEILDKIGKLVRERFKIWGQIQALTGEGRLSGIVLLALPPCLFIVMWRMNPNYVSILFEDPLGHQMLAGAVVMQILGALVIKKIIDIKV